MRATRNLNLLALCAEGSGGNDDNLLSPSAEGSDSNNDPSSDTDSSDDDEDPVSQQEMTEVDCLHPPPPPCHEHDEFPDYEAQDAVPDLISQVLEDDSPFPHLPFKWKEWEEGDKIAPKPGHTALEGLEFRDTFDKKGI